MLFSPSGRIRRRDYWLWWIVILGLNILFSKLSGVLLSRDDHLYIVHSLGFAAPPAFIAAVLGNAFLTAWIDFNLVAKRIHDRNKPAVIAGIVPVANALYAGSAFIPAGDVANIIVKVLVVGVGVWMIVECGCLDGTKGPNKYGPSPKVPAPADVF